MPGGRPTKYDPAWVEKLPEMFAAGQSVLEVAVNLGISRDSVYAYAKIYPEFSDALTRGKELSQAWWERQGREGLYDITEYDEKGRPCSRRSINHSIWNKNVACRFRVDWADRQELAGVGGDAIAIRIIKASEAPEGKSES
jgi:hypothetical protein